MLQKFKIIVEKHSDGHVAYLLGLKGVVIAEGDTYERTLNNVKSALNSTSFNILQAYVERCK
jgi:hypothetical protein